MKYYPATWGFSYTVENRSLYVPWSRLSRFVGGWEKSTHPTFNDGILLYGNVMGVNRPDRTYEFSWMPTDSIQASIVKVEITTPYEGNCLACRDHCKKNHFVKKNEISPNKNKNGFLFKYIHNIYIYIRK